MIRETTPYLPCTVVLAGAALRSGSGITADSSALVRPPTPEGAMLFTQGTGGHSGCGRWVLPGGGRTRAKRQAEPETPLPSAEVHLPWRGTHRSRTGETSSEREKRDPDCGEGGIA